MFEYDLLIIGGGPGGLTSAIYGSRAGLKTVVLEKVITGGQLRLTSGIENYPGIVHISGADLSKNFHEQAIGQGAEIKSATVKEIIFDGDIKVVKTSEGDYRVKTLVIASGSRHRNLTCPGAQQFVGRGISFCALCDGGFVKDEIVAVVGGGNSALEEADYLTRFASKIYVIHRRDEFRADKAIQIKTKENPKIEFLLSSEIVKIEGDDLVNKIHVKNSKTGEIGEYDVTGVFMYVGNEPNVSFLPKDIKTTPAGWIVTDHKLETSVPGVFAVGDVRDTDLRQVVTAVADGARAAVYASRYIEEKFL
jgi:thioredoxin reductase (NADPH)